MNVVPHVSQIAAGAGYAVSVQKRKSIEQGFGSAKNIGSI